MTGRIFKSTGGFYYVECNNEIFECKGRGLFRKDNICLAVGDIVDFEARIGQTGNIIKLHDRKNELIRPFISNLDVLVIVLVNSDSQLNLYNTDKLTAIALYKDIEPIIVINKTDTFEHEPIKNLYERVGFKVYAISALRNDGTDELKRFLSGKFSALAGVSGVGKSSIINALSDKENMAVGDLSLKLGTGKHTTRHIEIIKTSCQALIADTPGFSAIETLSYDKILKDELAFLFPEFSRYFGKCKFGGCSHTVEKGCAVLEGLANGEICISRHESYKRMYNEQKNIKEWNLK